MDSIEPVPVVAAERHEGRHRPPRFSDPGARQWPRRLGLHGMTRQDRSLYPVASTPHSLDRLTQRSECSIWTRNFQMEASGDRLLPTASHETMI